MSIKHRVKKLEMKKGFRFHIVCQKEGETQQAAIEAYCKENEVDPNNSSIVCVTEADLAAM